MFDLIRSLTKWKGSEQRTKEFKRISEQLGMTFSARVKGRAKDQATPPLPLFREGRSRVVTNMRMVIPSCLDSLRSSRSEFSRTDLPSSSRTNT